MMKNKSVALSIFGSLQSFVVQRLRLVGCGRTLLLVLGFFRFVVKHKKMISSQPFPLKHAFIYIHWSPPTTLSMRVNYNKYLIQKLQYKKNTFTLSLPQDFLCCNKTVNPETQGLEKTISQPHSFLPLNMHAHKPTCTNTL